MQYRNVFWHRRQKNMRQRSVSKKSIYTDVRILTKIVSTNTQRQKMEIVQAKVTK
jgi:hypothetical protein